MKKILGYALAFFICSIDVYAQNEVDITTNQEYDKKDILERSLKDAKKHAKLLRKDGWKPAAGTLPIENQLNNLYLRTNAGMSKYIIGFGEGKSASYTTARKAAVMRARVEIGEKMGAEVAGLAEDAGDDVGLNDTDKENIRQFTDASKQLMSRSIGLTEVVLDIYRETDGKTEVQIQLSYDGKRAKEDILKAFKNESEEMKAKIDKLLSK
ncbi:MAG: hypothetical protein II122_01860, partial [Bacteroidaceae bacterium]|nr:hypothetical protein [Bacteroidaceae bacterium]